MRLKSEIIGYCVCIFLMMSSVSPISSNCRILDETPPQFDSVGDLYSDYGFREEGISIQLAISVRVFDEDGIDTVIGSYKEDSATIWNNITLAYNHTSNEDWERYVGYGPVFNLTPTNRYRVWNAMFYTNDTLGNWNKSCQRNYFYNMFGPQVNPFESIIFYGALSAIVIISIIGIAFWRKHRV